MEIIFALILYAVLCVGVFLAGIGSIITGFIVKSKSEKRGDGSKAYRILIVSGAVGIIIAVILVIYIFHILK